MDLASLRNIGIAAHIDAGKTTVSERILHCTGVEHRVGLVDDGTTVLDWMEEERERGITITAAATTVPWRDSTLNLIDTPGHVDFTVEVERCMRVLDGAVLVIDAVSGVQAQSETVWRQIRSHDVPALAFVNKCDRAGADFLAAAQSLKDKLGAPALPIQYPIYVEGQVRGVANVLERQAWVFNAKGEPAEIDVPESISDELDVLREELLEHLSDHDDGILSALLEEEEVDLAMAKAALRRQTIDGALVPVLCGAALRGIGIQPLLDAVVDYLPSPLDRPAVTGFDPDGDPLPPRAPDPKLPLTALTFKLHAGPHGDLTFARIYSGTMTAGSKLWNPRVRKMERPARLLRMHGEGGESVDSAGPGEIVALTGLKFTGSGDTLCDRSDPILLEPPVYPEPVIALVVEPESSGDRDKLRQAFQRLAHEDPSFRVKEDEDAGQWLIEGMGELHLEVQLHRVVSEFKVEPRVGQPRVSYREAVRSKATGSSRIERTLGGKDVFGHVELEVSPGEGSLGVEIVWSDGDVIPTGMREAVEGGVHQEALSGPRFGFPLAGCTVKITGGGSHERMDSEVAFAQAAMAAMRAALQAAEVVLLEPQMALEVQAPEEFASGIIADLGSRRCEVEDVLADCGSRTIRGRCPLINMFGYSTVVRSMSQGRASYTLSPAGFSDVPEEELASRGLTWS